MASRRFPRSIRAAATGDDAAVTQSVELLLDEATAAAVRAQWDALAEAGLPSQARHTGESNRPHVTMAARRAIDPALEPALSDAVSPLPLPLRVGAVACFGRGPYVLVRVVVANRALLDLQAAVTAALGPDPRTAHHFAPGSWTPHVSLARRLTADQVGRALSALGVTPDLAGHAVGLPPLGRRRTPGVAVVNRARVNRAM